MSSLGIGLCDASIEDWTIDRRDVHVVIPATNKPVPIFVAMHGYKETPQRLEEFSDLSMLAANGAAIIAYPSGTPLDLGFGWNSGAARFATKDVDDVAVLAHVVAALIDLPCADPHGVILVGESNGGGMALRATCDERFDGRLRGVVLVNPAIDSGVMSTCAADVSPTGLVVVAGRRDKVIPYDGSRRPFVGVESWFPDVATTVAGCQATGVSAMQLSDTTTVHLGQGCVGCAVQYELADSGHTWPGGTSGMNGAPTGTFALTALLMDSAAGRVGRCGPTAGPAAGPAVG